ncbi:unnamed protein product [Amoebophrya sp. A120]|nr:unnamed protein product [Amoebophrya sp. A120]|eukprot:GSA120T00000780001.1
MLATAATMIEKEQLQYTKKKNFIYTFISTSMLVLPQLQHLRHPHSRPSTSYHHSRHEEFHGKQPNFFLYCNILSAVLFHLPPVDGVKILPNYTQAVAIQHPLVLQRKHVIGSKQTYLHSFYPHYIL